MNNSKQDLLESLNKNCVITDFEGSPRSLNEINKNTYVAIVAVNRTSEKVTVFIDNVEAEDRKDYSIKDFMVNVLDFSDNINPTRIKDFKELNNELKHDSLKKLLPQSDGSFWACIDGYVETDTTWNAKNENAGAHSLIISAKDSDVSLEWVARKIEEIVKVLNNGDNEILSEAQEARDLAKNPEAYYGVHSSDFSSIKPSVKKRF